MQPDLLVCGQCAWSDPCGGMGGVQQSLHGCFTHCMTPGLCEKLTWVCPCRGDIFRSLVRDVGGLHDRPWQPLLGPEARLPRYIPMLRHGRKRTSPFARPMVGISIRDLLPRNGEHNYYPVATTPDGLRDRFGIARGAPLLVSGVAPDHVIESYWAYRNVTDVPARLAELGITAMTTPNFSFFSDAPRTHTLFARKRIMITAEELSVHRIAVIPHVNALTKSDWKFWEELLALQTHLTYVAKEFQTGNRDPRKGLRAIDELRGIQDRLGRAIHPVVIGGAQYVQPFAQHFSSFTIADSHPFMRAMHRRMLVGHGARVRSHYSPLDLDTLLELNVRRWEDALRARAEVRGRRITQLRLAS